MIPHEGFSNVCLVDPLLWRLSSGVRVDLEPPSRGFLLGVDRSKGWSFCHLVSHFMCGCEGVGGRKGLSFLFLLTAWNFSWFYVILSPCAAFCAIPKNVLDWPTLKRKICPCSSYWKLFLQQLQNPSLPLRSWRSSSQSGSQDHRMIGSSPLIWCQKNCKPLPYISTCRASCLWKLMQPRSPLSVHFLFFFSLTLVSGYIMVILLLYVESQIFTHVFIMLHFISLPYFSYVPF